MTIALEFAGRFCVLWRSVYAVVGHLILEDVYNDHTFCRTYYCCSSLHSLCRGMRIRTAPPSKACVDAARLYAEALDTDKAAPEGEKAEKITIKKEALAALEERKDKACGE